MGLEDSNYDDKPGYKIETKEKFAGTDLKITEKAKMNMTDDAIAAIGKGTFNKFHTTRYAIVNQLKNKEMQDDLKSGKEVGPVKCIYVAKPKKGGNPYWELGDG